MGYTVTVSSLSYLGGFMKQSQSKNQEQGWGGTANNNKQQPGQKEQQKHPQGGQLGGKSGLDKQKGGFGNDRDNQR